MQTLPTVLVLGASGTTGRRLVPLLRAAGVDVRPAHRSGAVRFDWSAPATFDAALDGVDAVYLIPPPLVADPLPLVRPFLEAARRSVRRIVLVSSLGVTFDEEPATSGRRALERAVAETGIAHTILRPGGFAQNFSEGFLRPGVLGGVVAGATGDGAVAFVDADDIAAVAAAALLEKVPGDATLALTGPAALRFDEAVERIARASGRAVAYRAISDADFAAMLGRFGLPADYVQILVRDQRAIARGEGARVSDDVERVIGRAPRSFEEFVRDAASAWQS